MPSIVEVNTEEVAEPVELATAKRFLRLPAADSPDDADITAIFIPGSRKYVENLTGLTLANRDFVQYQDSFPGYNGAFPFDSDPAAALSFLFGYGGIGSCHLGPYGRNKFQQRLMRAPVTEIDHISYIGTDGISHDLQPGTDFAVDFSTIPGRISPLPGGRWPQVMRGTNNVRIFFKAGYLAPNAEQSSVTLSAGDPPKLFTAIAFNVGIPEHLLAAILQIIVHWYQNRDVIIAAAGAGGPHQPLPHHFDAIVNLERVYDFSPPE